MSRESRVARAQAKAGVMVGYCHTDRIDATFHTCLVSLLLYDTHHSRRVVDHGDICALSSGPRIASARNQIVDAFLRHPREPRWLFMVDTDMTFPADRLDTMVELAQSEDLPILGGLAFSAGRTGKIEPCIRVVKQDEETNGLAFETIWNYPPDSLVRIDTTGAACLLIRRDTIESMAAKYAGTPYPFFAESSVAGTEQPSELGEDITFCLRLRQLGIPLHVHTGFIFGHSKTHVIDQESYLEYRRGITEMGEEDYRFHQLQRSGLAPGPEPLVNIS